MLARTFLFGKQLPENLCFLVSKNSRIDKNLKKNLLKVAASLHSKKSEIYGPSADESNYSCT